MTPEQEQYIVPKKPERFFRVQMEIPDVAALDIGNIRLEICHGGKYTGASNSDGSPTLDQTDIPLGVVVNLGVLAETKNLSTDPSKFEECYLFLFTEINNIATGKIAVARIAKQQNI